MGVKHPYHRWQENKSCCQQQFAGKGRLRRMEQESWDTHGKVSQVQGDFTPPGPGPSEPREGDTIENLKAAMVTWLKPKWQRAYRGHKQRGLVSQSARGLPGRLVWQNSKCNHLNSFIWQLRNCMPFFTRIWNNICIFVGFEQEGCTIWAFCVLSKLKKK